MHRYFCSRHSRKSKSCFPVKLLVDNVFSQQLLELVGVELVSVRQYFFMPLLSVAEILTETKLEDRL